MPHPARGGDALPATGVALSASLVQIGAAVGATAFPVVGPIGVVAMRQASAALLLMVLVRPPLRRLGLRRLAPALLLGLVLVAMNLALYTAVQRIGLGLAVTIEFAGPLAIALLGGGPAGRARRIACGLLALGGVVLVTDPFSGTTPDPLGLAAAVAAGALWAAYILLSERAGALPGVTGTAVASLVGAVITLPVLVVVLLGVSRPALPHVLLAGAATGLLSSALPYSLDLLVLRRMPRSLFGMLQSVDPVAAALFGLLLLGQRLTGVQVVGIAAVCVANALALARRRRRPVSG